MDSVTAANATVRAWQKLDEFVAPKKVPVEDIRSTIDAVATNSGSGDGAMAAGEGGNIAVANEEEGVKVNIVSSPESPDIEVVFTSAPASPSKVIAVSPSKKIVDDIAPESMTVDQLKLSKEEFLKSRLKYNSVKGEKAKKIYDILEKIDHRKREYYCAGFYCVFDRRLVQSVNEKSLFSYNIDLGNPIDSTCPSGPAYYSEMCRSPLIRICDHSHCQPNADITYTIIRQLNGFSDIGNLPPPTSSQPYWPTPLIAGHHFEAESVISSLRGFKRFNQDFQGYENRQKFLVNYLRASKRMPVDGDYPKGDAVLEDIGDVIKREGHEAYQYKYNKKGENLRTLILACDVKSLSKWRFLMMSIYKDFMVDFLEPEDQLDGEGKHNFLPLDLIGTWTENLDFAGAFPAAFYLREFEEGMPEMPKLNSTMGPSKLRTTLYEREQFVEATIRKSRKLFSQVGEVPKHDIFKLEENTKIGVTYRSVDIKTTKKSFTVFFISKEITTQNRDFIKISSSDAEPVKRVYDHFQFEGNKLEYLIDSILDIFILHARYITQIARELMYNMHHVKFFEGKTYYMTRERFGICKTAEINSYLGGRPKIQYLPVLAGLNRPCLTLNFDEGDQSVIISKRTEFDFTEKTLSISLTQTLIVLKKLCRFHNLIGGKIQGMGSFGECAFKHALKRLKVASDFHQIFIEAQLKERFEGPLADESDLHSQKRLRVDDDDDSSSQKRLCIDEGVNSSSPPPYKHKLQKAKEGQAPIPPIMGEKWVKVPGSGREMSFDSEMKALFATDSESDEDDSEKK